MKFDTVEIEENDVVMVHHSIGNMAPQDVDKYCNRLSNKLVSIFGKGRVALFPVREGPTWDFTIIRKPKNENSNRSSSKRRS